MDKTTATKLQNVIAASDERKDVAGVTTFFKDGKVVGQFDTSDVKEWQRIMNDATHRVKAAAHLEKLYEKFRTAMPDAVELEQTYHPNGDKASVALKDANGRALCWVPPEVINDFAARYASDLQQFEQEERASAMGAMAAEVMAAGFMGFVLYNSFK